MRANVNESGVMRAIDAMVKLNEEIANASLRYEYVNLDDGWAAPFGFEDRFANGTIKIDRQAFPNGIRPMADAAHARGLKFGIYTDRGLMTCMRRAGSWRYEKIDAATYVEWGI